MGGECRFTSSFVHVFLVSFLTYEPWQRPLTGVGLGFCRAILQHRVKEDRLRQAVKLASRNLDAAVNVIWTAVRWGQALWRKPQPSNWYCPINSPCTSTCGQ